jgi:hypothetical protein
MSIMAKGVVVGGTKRPSVKDLTYGKVESARTDGPAK